MHHTKNKGDLGVLKAQCDLYSKGWIVAVPLTEHAPFDLICCKDDLIYRVQVKYRALCSGVLNVSLKSSWADKNGNHINYLDKTQVDLVCVYCPDTDLCYYFRPKDIGTNLTLRVNSPKNNQLENIKFANDYLQVP